MPHDNAPLQDPSVVQSLELLLGDKVEANNRTLLEGVAAYYILLGRSLEGLQCLQEAKNLHRKVFDWRGDARVLRRIGQLYQAKGDVTEAVKHWQQSIHSSREADDRKGEAFALELLASLLMAEERYGEAIRAYEETLGIKNTSGDQVGQASTLTQLGQSFSQLGRHQEALRCYRQALRIWKAEHKREEEAHCLQFITATYLSLGRFHDLIRAGGELLELFSELGMQSGRHRILQEMGLACRGVGDYDGATKAFSDALEAARQDNEKEGTIKALVALGRTLRDRAIHQDALRFLHQGEGESKEGSARHLVGWCMTELGIGLEAAGQQDDAKKVLNEAAKLLRTTGENDRGAIATLHLAGMQALSGGLSDAEATLVKAHQMAQGAGESFLLSSIYNFRGTVLWALGRSDEAHRWLQQGLEIMDEPFGAHDALDTRLLGTMVEPFEALVDLELRAGNVAEAWDVAGHAHAHRCVHQAEPLLLSDRTPNAAGPVGHCERILAQIRGSYIRLTETGEPMARKALREQIHEMRSELRKQQAAAEANHPEYSPMRFIRTIPYAEVQRTVEKGTVILDYMVGAHHTYVWAINCDTITPFVFPIGREQATQLTMNLLGALRNQESPETVLEHSKALSDAILGEIFGVLMDAERVLVVPDDVLYQVPFGALTTPDGGFFSHHWDVALVPTLPIWKVCHAKQKHVWRARATRRVLTSEKSDSSGGRRSSRGLLGGGGALTLGAPPTEGDAAVVEITSDQTVQEFEEAARKSVLLHVNVGIDLAEHAPFGTVVPLADGVLNLHDMARTSFAAHLAIFSGTESHMSQGPSGAEWISFFLPLVYGGMPSIIFSRWRVAPEVQQEFAASVFRHLQKGSNKAQSLRYAQIELMRTPQWSHPFNWASFDLFGDWS
ncbi:MAG: CHAT domain-containing protein [Candidatus Xenobia bacterium]